MKILNKILLAGLFLPVFLSCKTVSEADNISSTPEWANDAIWYQIFVERFHNGDPTNDPAPENIYSASDFFEIPDDWHITPWTQNWYYEDEWAKELGMDFYARLQLRRYGGDLQGVMDKLDYLSELGITAIYFNPLNDAPSLHKYDVRNFHHIDVNFGPDPEGDNLIIQSEDPANPDTWQWTAADLMFLELVDSLKNRGIRVVMDFSWNHTGVEFWAWKDILEKGAASEYSDWYDIISIDETETNEVHIEYNGWINISSLPEFKKIDTPDDCFRGPCFEGNLHPEVKQHVFDVTKKWLAPNGDVSKGVDGFRLDVAEHIPMGFWREYRDFVKNINPEAYLVGEVWWHEFPDKLMNPLPYVRGDVFDAVMFYQLYRPARYFFAKTDYEINAQQLVDSLTFQWDRLSPGARNAMMNTSATHDTPRLLTSFFNSGKYKYKAKLNDDPFYNAGKPCDDTYNRVRLYLIHQFTIPGAPHIWNGEEMGMWGADDPDCRKPLWWPEFSFEDETRKHVTDKDDTVDPVGFNSEVYELYKSLINIRKNNLVLSDGEIEFILADGKKLAYKRYNYYDTLFVFFNLEQSIYEYNTEEVLYFSDVLNDKIIPGPSITVEPMSVVIVRPLSSTGSIINKGDNNPKSQSSNIITAPVVKKNAYDKRGDKLDFEEYYVQMSVSDYFIKFCESIVGMAELETALEKIDSPIKALTMEVEFLEGEWDKCDELTAQSRIGHYVIIKSIASN